MQDRDYLVWLHGTPYSQLKIWHILRRLAYDTTQYHLNATLFWIADSHVIIIAYIGTRSKPIEPPKPEPKEVVKPGEAPAPSAPQPKPAEAPAPPIKPTPAPAPAPAPQPAHPSAKPGERYTDPLTGMEFVFVRGGSFQMGDMFGDGSNDEKPVHEVAISGFYIGEYEVTQGQWEKVMGNNPSYFKKGENYPVEQVSWNDIQEFTQKLNQRAGKKYRLPTEAEWEYAARSGGKREKWAGTSSESELGEYAWYSNNSGQTTHAVGQKKPNGLGLYDMSGNVWEWCEDWYGSDYYRNSPKSNPTGPSSGQYKVLRGGSWYRSTEVHPGIGPELGQPGGPGLLPRVSVSSSFPLIF